MKKLIITTIMVGTWALLPAQPIQAEESGHTWDGNRKTPVHLVPLMDEEGYQILPSYKDAMPFSVNKTCGPCHKYETVASGFHFNSTDPEAAHGRPGEPWVWVDEATGTQLPLSYRGWEGTWNPKDLGISDWNFTTQFGRHLPGGDMAEPEDLYEDRNARWSVSGPVEINCLGCHNGSPFQDQSEWAKQIGRENFRWAATAASGLADVGGMASRLPEQWTVHDGLNPDDHVYAVPPSANYRAGDFNEKNLLYFDIKYRAKDENCNYCHSATETHQEKWEQDIDVHSTSGMICVDCHRNGLDHNIIRGYEGEAQERGIPAVGDFSCEGCHMGNPEGQGASAMGGRLGAPKPLHEGLPEIHFERLTCTACHSGPWPEDAPARIRAARANRTGIHGVAQWFTDAPNIAAPVFVKEDNGKIAPHRMMWPAFWARLDGENVTPLLPEDIETAAKGILDAEQQVGKILTDTTKILLSALVAPSEAGEVLLLTPGREYRVNIDGGLNVTEYEIPEKPEPIVQEMDEDGYPIPIDYAALRKDKYPYFEGDFLWAIERTVETELKDEEGNPLFNDDGYPQVDTRILIFPLVNDFDASAGELDYDAEGQMLAALQGLAVDEATTAQPVLVNGSRLYWRTPDEYIDFEDLPEGQSYGRPTWMWRENGELRPLVPDHIIRALPEIVGVEAAFDEEQVALTLKALKAEGGGDYAYIANGQLFKLGENGELTNQDHDAAKPYSWAIGHDVRPAEQSLGAKACTDCHAKDAPFLMAEVQAQGPLLTGKAPIESMHERHGYEKNAYIKTALFFKWLIIITMTLLIIHILLDVYRQYTVAKKIA